MLRFSKWVLVVVLSPLLVPELFADTPIIIDTTTQYTRNTQINGGYGCSGTCDLNPAYNYYEASSPFSISKITFQWYNNGGNNCDGFGHYYSAISTTGGASGVIATSSNTIYLGCAGYGGGEGGTGELDFTGQAIPANFYLDFASIDGLQGGSNVVVYDVEIWGESLLTFTATSGSATFEPNGLGGGYMNWTFSGPNLNISGNSDIPLPNCKGGCRPGATLSPNTSLFNSFGGGTAGGISYDVLCFNGGVDITGLGTTFAVADLINNPTLAGRAHFDGQWIAATSSNGQDCDGAPLFYVNFSRASGYQVSFEPSGGGYYDVTQGTYSMVSLGFPLKGQELNAYNAPIVSVFDHSMQCKIEDDAQKCLKEGEYRVYGCDGSVQGYTAESGIFSYGTNTPGHLCRASGYAQDAIFSPFYVNGMYRGSILPKGIPGTRTSYLNYDGHAGIDYGAAFGTKVFAATDGVACYPTWADLKAQGISIGGDPDIFNVLEIDPSESECYPKNRQGSYYRLFYLHLSTHARTISLPLTANVTGQDFVATELSELSEAMRTGPDDFKSNVEALPDYGEPLASGEPQRGYSISGKVTLNGKPFPKQVTLFLEGDHVGCNDGKPVTVLSNTDDGTYNFSGLSAGLYQIRASLDGYAFEPANPNTIVKDGELVTKGERIALSGNAGPCLAQHLHFEVQNESSTEQRKVVKYYSYIPVDPYGWDGDPGADDPYPKITGGMTNELLWDYVPIVTSISPASAPSNTPFPLTISGYGFDPGSADCLIKQRDDYSNPMMCIRGVLQNQTSGQIVVQEKPLAAGTYFVHVNNSDGNRSNWKKLVVQ